MSLFVLLLLPFAGSLLTAFLPTRARTALAGVAGAVSAMVAVWTILMFPQVRDGGLLREAIPWVPSLGIEIVLRLDGFSWMFATIVTVVGAMV